MSIDPIDKGSAPQDVDTTDATQNGDAWKLVMRHIAQGDNALRNLVSFGTISKGFYDHCCSHLLVSMIPRCHPGHESTTSTKLGTLEPHKLLAIDGKGRQYSKSIYGSEFSRTNDILYIFDPKKADKIVKIDLSANNRSKRTQLWNNKVDDLYPMDDGFAIASYEGLSLWKFDDPTSCKPKCQQFFPHEPDEDGQLSRADPLGLIDGQFFYHENNKVGCLCIKTGERATLDSGKLEPNLWSCFATIGDQSYLLHKQEAYSFHKGAIETDKPTQFPRNVWLMHRPFVSKHWVLDVEEVEKPCTHYPEQKEKVELIRVRKGLNPWLSQMEIIRPNEKSKGESLFFVDDFLFLGYAKGKVRIIHLPSQIEMIELAENIQKLLNDGLKNKDWILHGLSKEGNTLKFSVQYETFQTMGGVRNFSLEVFSIDLKKSSFDHNTWISAEDFTIDNIFGQEPEAIVNDPISVEEESSLSSEEEIDVVPPRTPTMHYLFSSTIDDESRVVEVFDEEPVGSSQKRAVLVEDAPAEEMHVTGGRIPHYRFSSKTDDYCDGAPRFVEVFDEDEPVENPQKSAVPVANVPAPVSMILEEHTFKVAIPSQSEGCTLEKIIIVVGGIFLLITLAASIALLVLHPGKVIFEGHGIILTLPTVITLASGGGLSIILIAIGSCTWWLIQQRSPNRKTASSSL